MPSMNGPGATRTSPVAPSRSGGFGGGAPAPIRRSAMVPEGDKRRGVFMIGSMIMGLLTLAAASWFFQDQIKAAWRTHNMHDSHEQDSSSVDISSHASKTDEPPVVSLPPDKPSQAESPAKSTEPTVPAFDPNAPPPKALAPDSNEPATGLSSNSTTPAASSISKEGPPVNVPTESPNTPPKNLIEVPPGGAPKAIPAPEPAKPLTVKATPDAEPAVEVLKQFFAATSWKERLKYVQLPDQLQPAMEEYYASNPDGPIPIEHIELLRQEKKPQQGVPHCVFEVSGSGESLATPLPIMVEETKAGYRVDWLTFTEFKDRLLLKFGQGYTDRSARFHVMIRRAHYFDDDVPQRDTKDCFDLLPPIPGFLLKVFVTKGTPLAKELERSVGWEIASAAAIVELQWHKQDNYQWVELVKVPQFHWRNIP